MAGIERLTPPFCVEAHDACYKVVDANGAGVAFVYFRDRTGAIGTNLTDRMSRETARRVAGWIARLPELVRERATIQQP